MAFGSLAVERMGDRREALQPACVILTLVGQWVDYPYDQPTRPMEPGRARSLPNPTQNWEPSASVGILAVVSGEEVGGEATERTHGHGARNITIGPVTTDHADYDAEHDVLYLHVGEPQPGEGEEAPAGHNHPLRARQEQDRRPHDARPSRILERDGHLVVTIPEAIETTAADLAPALAAS